MTAAREGRQGPKRDDSLSICLVSPLPPPFGGMAIQAVKIATLLREEGHRVVEVRTNSREGEGGWAGGVPGVRSLLNLVRFLSELDGALRQTEVVYLLSGFFNFFIWVTCPALLLAFYRRKPVVLSARGGNAAEFFRRYGWVARPLLRRVTLVTTPSGFLQQVFKEAFGIEAQVVPNIADLEQFVFHHRQRFRPQLLVTRNLEEIYGIDTVLRAFALVIGRHPEARLQIAGDGSLRQRLEELAETLHLKEQVSFLGAVNHTQIQRLYAQCDIYINASRIDNLPGSLLEAFVSGMPVVSTAAGGIPHLVEDGVTGLLTKIDDHKGLAEQVQRLLDSPELARRLVLAAYAESQRYSRGSIAPRLSGLLRECARGGRPEAQWMATDNG